MIPAIGDLIRCTTSIAVKRVTLVEADHPGEWDGAERRVLGVLLRIEADVLDYQTRRVINHCGYSQLEQAPSGNLRRVGDTPEHWGYIGEIVVIERPRRVQVDLFGGKFEHECRGPAT